MKNLFCCLVLCLFAFTACQNGSDTSDRQKQDNDTIRLKLEILNRQIEADQTNPDLYNKRAKFYLLDHQFDKALKDVHKAITIDDGKAASYVLLSDIYLLMGKPDESRDALNKAISKNPKDVDALLKLAKLFLIVKDYKNCYATVNQLLTIDNGNASAFFTRAIGLLEQGDTLRAVDDLKHAVDNNQEYYDAYVQLGELYSIKKDPVAELYLKNALHIRPKSREALYMLGLFYQETGKYEQAITTYQLLANSDTAFREAPFNIGYIYLVYLKENKKATRLL
ncbi:MAG: tetratricopeptide repeat protein [Bacteroidetes bacterium]|nr:tetratricopeptide repeat protein [Bacteroidota bacterium]